MSEEPKLSGSRLIELDPELLYQYMLLLDDVLGSEEIRSALEDQNLSSNQVRMACVAAVGEVLSQAEVEYATYVEALEHYDVVRALRHGRRDAAELVLRHAARFLCVSGIASIAFGVAAGFWWPDVRFLLWPGVAGTIVGVMAYGLARLRRTELGFRMLGEHDAAAVAAAALDHTRGVLLDAVRGEPLLGFVRTMTNEARSSSLGQGFAVSASPGLSEVYDAAYHVSTEVARQTEDLIDQLAGGSIGVAGTRGSGKSTLVRGYCEDFGHGGDLRCMVSAPVDYEARDFVLHLFATFCRSVRTQLGRRGADRPAFAVWREAVLKVLPSALRWSGLGLALLFFRDLLADAVAVPVWLPGSVTLLYGVVGGAVGAAVTAWRDMRPDGLLRGWAYAAVESVRIAVFWASLGGAVLVVADHLPDQSAYVAVAAFVIGAVRVVRRTWQESRAMRSSRGLARRRLLAAAERDLQRVRYLQTTMTGWAGGLKIPLGVEGQRTRGISKAEQPRSYPEIVEEFREFALQVARHLHADGHRVFIGVDELDKIGSAEHAERFLNEIKGIFGIPHAYFLVSVSDDALTSFERRGLPLRDAFDSSFDEILRVEPLTYVESRRLIYRRVIGLTEPYVAFCHVLSGGLARDLIRTARQVVRAGRQPADQRLPEISAVIIDAEIRRKIRAAAQVIASLEDADADPLLVRLYRILHDPVPYKPSVELIQDLSAFVPARSAVGRDLLTYLYFLVTLHEVFGERLDESLLLWATEDGERHPGHFDALATARLTFAHNTQVSWQLIDQFRAAWTLPPAELTQS